MRPQNDKIPRLRATIGRTSLGMTLILPSEISQAFALRQSLILQMSFVALFIKNLRSKSAISTAEKSTPVSFCEEPEPPGKKTLISISLGEEGTR